MRLSRCEVRDHINCRKNDRWRSHRFYSALQRQNSPNRYICEIFGASRFSSIQHNQPEADIMLSHSIIDPANTPFSRRQSSGGPGIIAFRRTAKMTAVDQPNNSTPFIAVIGASNCQRRNGVTSP